MAIILDGKATAKKVREEIKIKADELKSKCVFPKLAVISVGENNDYNHPTETVLKRLQKNNIKVYRTDLNGNIILTTDGEKIKIEVEKINGSNS